MSRAGSNAHVSPGWKAVTSRVLFARPVLVIGREVAGRQHEAVDGRKALGPGLVSPQADPQDVLSPGEIEGAAVIPGHRAAVVRTVRGDVERLLHVAETAGFPRVLVILLFENRWIKLRRGTAIQTVEDAGAGVGPEPEVIGPGGGHLEVVLGPTRGAACLGAAGDLPSAGQLLRVDGIKPGVAMGLAAGGALALDPDQAWAPGPAQASPPANRARIASDHLGIALSRRITPPSGLGTAKTGAPLLADWFATSSPLPYAAVAALRGRPESAPIKTPLYFGKRRRERNLLVGFNLQTMEGAPTRIRAILVGASNTRSIGIVIMRSRR